MKIKQVSELTGVSASAIRYYESQGFLPATKRTAGGYRQYSQEDVLNIRLIKFNQKLGFKLSELENIAHPKDNINYSELVNSLTQKKADIKALIDELKHRLKLLSAIEKTAENYWLKSECIPPEELEKLLSLDT